MMQHFAYSELPLMPKHIIEQSYTESPPFTCQHYQATLVGAPFTTHQT